MPIKKIPVSLLLCFFVAYLVGCGLTPKLISEERLSTPNLITKMPSITITQIIEPTKVTVPINTATKVNVVTTPTVILPTRFPQDSWLGNMISILSSNGNCNLPCWWGVNPGESNLQSFNFVFYPIGYEEINKQGIFSEDFSMSVNQVNIPNLLIKVSFENNFVQRIYVLADNINKPGDKVSHFDAFAQAMEYYSLENTLKKYGIPTNVYLRLYPRYEPNAPLIYSLWVFYENLGILIHYRGEGLVYKDKEVDICPDYDKLYLIEFYLQSAQDNSPLSEPTDNTQAFTEQVSQGLLLPIGNATSLTLEEFQNIFTSEKHEKCFQSPIEFWP